MIMTGFQRCMKGCLLFGERCVFYTFTTQPNKTWDNPALESDYPYAEQPLSKKLCGIVHTLARGSFLHNRALVAHPDINVERDYGPIITDHHQLYSLTWDVHVCGFDICISEEHGRNTCCWVLKSAGCVHDSPFALSLSDMVFLCIQNKKEDKPTNHQIQTHVNVGCVKKSCIDVNFMCYCCLIPQHDRQNCQAHGTRIHNVTVFMFGDPDLNKGDRASRHFQLKWVDTFHVPALDAFFSNGVDHCYTRI